MKLIIQGETPAKKNSRINTRSGRSFPSKKYTEWHKNASSHIPFLDTIENPCVINLHFIHGDLRRRDSDNGTSSILDLLVDSKVLKDDNWQIVKELHIKNSYEKNKPRCEIEIREIENEKTE